EKQKIELAKLQLAKLEKEVELQRVKNKALSLNPAAKVEEKQFETLNKETATHIGIREAEDWFRPIDLAKDPGSGNEEKREIVLNETSRTLQRKASMRSTKDQHLKRRSNMPVKQCFPVEPSGCRRGAFAVEELSGSAEL
ncbi:hypothetical protein TNCV_2544161, partial [Trichonephila clavipes]